MDYNGDVLICAHDWRKKYIVGNVYKESFLDIWTGKRFMNARKLLLEANRNFSPCNVCDVDGTLIGKTNATYFI